MKNVAAWFYLIVAGCCPGGSAAAQETALPKPRLQHEIGLNATALLNKVFRFSSDSSTVNPYLLTYRLSYRHWGVRLGAGATYHFERSVQEGFRDSETERRSSFDARFGLDYRVRFGRRFVGNFGLDALGKWRLERDVIDSGFDVVTRVEQSRGWGGGPAIGLTFWLSPRLGLATEAAFYLVYNETERARNFKNFPELDDEIFRNNTEDLLTILPTSLFLIYHF